jgi:hypothetical protein
MTNDRIAGWMKNLEAGCPNAPLPPADIIWWRAQLRQRIVVEERLNRPLRIAEQLVCAGFVIAAVVLVAVR